MLDGLWRDNDSTMLFRLHNRGTANLSCSIKILKGNFTGCLSGIKLYSVIPKQTFIIQLQNESSVTPLTSVADVLIIPKIAYQYNPPFYAGMSIPASIGMSDQQLEMYRPSGVTIEEIKAAQVKYKERFMKGLI
jgi:hypothetical protein